MRQLVVCCDGTWMTSDKRTDGVPTPTNVCRLFNALEDVDRTGSEQLKYYHPGVGTDGGLLDKVAGGGLGIGLSRNIKSAYAWLARTYQPGDAISLFGFSRGAYTVRSLAGMIAACGLLRFGPDLSPAERWARVDAAYDHGYRPGKDRNPQWSDGLDFHDLVSIRMIGVWDTVGSLGVPDSFGVLNLFDVESRHKFHDTTLSPMVEHARHAVAMDETRAQFTPTLWADPGYDEHSGHSFKQVWFPGNHGDVGGGHLETGLSDAALRWMVSESVKCAGLSYRVGMLAQLHPNAQDVLHDDCVGIYRHLGPLPRAVPLIDQDVSAEVIHDSVFCRQSNPPITAGPYRPTMVLKPGESRQFEIHADKPWNDAGIYLVPGRYAFAADGEWMDRRVPCGPAGASDGVFHTEEMSNLIGSVRSWWETQFKNLTGNTAVKFFGTKRVVDSPWMALIGVVTDGRFDEKTGVQRPYEPFEIGERCEQQVSHEGYLYTYANDSWGFYENNHGSVTLTVTRTE